MTDPTTPDDTPAPTAEEQAARNARAARRMTMDYPVELIQQPTGADTAETEHDRPTEA
jgi:hypothetical protein